MLRVFVILSLPEASEPKAERRRTAKDLKMRNCELKRGFQQVAPVHLLARFAGTRLRFTSGQLEILRRPSPSPRFALRGYGSLRMTKRPFVPGWPA
jgi:hypothetical protein